MTGNSTGQQLSNKQASEGVERLSKLRLLPWALPLGFQVCGSGVGPENLHLCQAPSCCWPWPHVGCVSGDQQRDRACPLVSKMRWQLSYALAFNLQVLRENGSILDGMSSVDSSDETRQIWAGMREVHAQEMVRHWTKLIAVNQGRGKRAGGHARHQQRWGVLSPMQPCRNNQKLAVDLIIPEPERDKMIVGFQRASLSYRK